MNLPNKLTISRLVFTFAFMCCIFYPGAIAKTLAIFFFMLAALTDYFDGRIARKRNLITNFGKLMDPIADKILVLAAFLAFVELKLMPAWMIIIILSRELLITGIRLLCAAGGIVIAAAKEGKHKTVSQFFSIFVVLFLILIRELCSRLGIWSSGREVLMKNTIFMLFFITTFLTLISGITFLYRNRELFAVK